MIGKNISQYEITKKIGEGGMGVVYKARDTKLDRPVALKFLPKIIAHDKDKQERFIQEAKAASSLDHPNICTIYEINETDEGQPYIAMGYYEGETLSQKIKKGPLRIEKALDIAVQVAEGLNKSHQEGIIHRDIKPGNIQVTNDGVAKILDFGLAKVSDISLTTDGSTLGTVAYMSPEQAAGKEIDHRTDIWALGVVLFEMLTGELPFQGEYRQALIYSILNDPPARLQKYLSDIPVEFTNIINRALEKDPDYRYQHIDDMLCELKRLKRDTDQIPGQMETEVESSITETQTTSEKSTTSSGSKTTTIVITPKKRNLILGLTALGIMILIAVTFFFSKGGFSGKESGYQAPDKSLAVMYFDNRTGKEGLEKILVDMLTTNLSRFESLDVVSSQRLYDILRAIGKEDVRTIDKEVATEVAKQANVKIMMLGSIIQIGDRIRINAQLSDVSTGRNIGSEQVDGKQIEDLFTMADELTQKVVDQIGVEAEKEQQVNIANLTTQSIEAYNYYIQGLKAMQLLYHEETVSNMEKALALDSTFASAYLYLAQAYNDLQNIKKRNQAIQKAKKFSTGATEKERLYIDAYYAIYIERNRAKRFRIFEKIASKFPNDKRIHYLLGGIYSGMDTQKALNEYQKVLELDPNYGPVLNALAYLYMQPENQDFEKALKYVRQYQKLHPDDANPHDTMADLYFFMGRIDDAIEKYKDAARINPGFSEYRIGYMYSLQEEYDESLYWIDQSITMAETRGDKAERYQWRGFIYYWLGRYSKAIEDMQRSAEIFTDLNNNYKVALSDFYLYRIYNEAGMPEKSNIHLNKMEEYFNQTQYEHTSVFYIMFKMLTEFGDFDINSVIDTSKADPAILSQVKTGKKWAKFYYNYIYPRKLITLGAYDRAIKFCQDNIQLKIRTTSNPESYIFYNFTRKNVLAQAFMKNGDTTQTIQEYKKILQPNPDRNDLRLIHPTFHYGLARAYQKNQQDGKAIEHYRRFLQYWDKADQSNAEVEDARENLKILESQANK
ncbi:MAG: protein kinase [Candidatus Marinimicrobia bacterium]|nr:protein kinase [Candidatus Neomarinimicrobiota bacterium]